MRKLIDKKFIAAGSILAALRVSSLWVGNFLLTNTFDDRQVMGYFLSMLSLPEAALLKNLRKDLVWQSTLSVLLIAGSFMFVYFITYVLKGRRPSGQETIK